MYDCKRFIMFSAVIQLIWMVNTGQLITACCDDVIYLWDVRYKQFRIRVIGSVPKKTF